MATAALLTGSLDRESVSASITPDFARFPAPPIRLPAAPAIWGGSPADLPMDRILIHLSSSPQQQAALDQLLADQHDPASPLFHQWLTPDRVWRPVRRSPSRISKRLSPGCGRTASGSTRGRGRRTMEFSGTAGQVERAFHTEIHHYHLDGERHIAQRQRPLHPRGACAGDRPAWLRCTIFRTSPMHREFVGRIGNPGFTHQSNGGAHGLSPYDFATIYNLTRCGMQNFDGAGQAIAIAGRTNIRPADAATFRSTFGLTANPPQIILNGPDPGIVSAGEEMEADLDVQWSGAVANGAAVKFVVSKSTNASDGVDLSSQYIVNNNLAPVMSVSFGCLRSHHGQQQSSTISLWQQAAAQGISVFVSCGRFGLGGLRQSVIDSPRCTALGVNGLASTPYNVAVGGTQFADTAIPGGGIGTPASYSHLAPPGATFRRRPGTRAPIPPRGRRQ